MIEKGLIYISETVVSVDNSAKTIGSGDLDVFATPAMIALMENAAMNAVVNEIPEDCTTVGGMINTNHVKPTGLGETVFATATLEEIEGKKLTFKVVARDSKGIIGECTHIRYIVNREKFMSKLQ